MSLISIQDVSLSNSITGKPTYLPRQFGGVGATIESKIGASGALVNESGFDADTGVALWPWPNEARIKNEMCTAAGVTRGFCSDASLTNYVWNYLGNGNPIGGGTTVAAPRAPTNLRITK